MNRKNYKDYEKFIERENFKKIIKIGAITVAAGISANYLLKKNRSNKFTTYKREFNYDDSNVYFIGESMASLAGAAYLIKDCNIKGENINIIEDIKTSDFNNDEKSLIENEFICRSERVFDEKVYENFWEFFSSIPSVNYPDKSVSEEIINFNYHRPAYIKAHLIDKYGDIVDLSITKLSSEDKTELFKLMITDDEILDGITIEEWFNEHFFKTNFWYMWQSTFAFQKWSNIVEFKNYMNKIFCEFNGIETFEGVTRASYNNYESVVIPLKKYLEDHGVNFIKNSKVTDLEFKEGPGVTVTAIHMEKEKNDEGDVAEDTINSEVSESNSNQSEKQECHDGIDSINTENDNSENEEENSEKENFNYISEEIEEEHKSSIVSEVMQSLHITESKKYNEETIYLNDNDKCIMINRASAHSIACGDYYNRPKYYDSKLFDEDLWEKIILKKPGLNSTEEFFNYSKDINCGSFIIKCRDDKLLKYIDKFSINTLGSGSFITFKDSNWFISIVVDSQENINDENSYISIIRAYVLYPDKTGNYINKPMIDCTGEELLIELLYHLHLIDKKDEILKKDMIDLSSFIIPYKDVQLQLRKIINISEIIPKGSTNFAVINDLVDMSKNMIFSQENSIFAAKIAIYELFNMNKDRCSIKSNKKNSMNIIKAFMKFLAID